MSNPTSSTPTYSAVQARTKSREARSATEAERDAQRKEAEAKTQSLMGQYIRFIISQLPTPEQIDLLAEKGCDSTLVHWAHPPSKVNQTIDGQVERVPRYPAEETHFAGFKGLDKEQANPTDHYTNGVPRVGLIQGFRNPATKKADPKTLPGGKTVVQLLNEWMLAQFDNPKDSMCFRTVWNGKHSRVEIHLVWDEEQWDRRQQRRQEQQEKRQLERSSSRPGPTGPTQTLDEYMAAKDARTSRTSRTSRRSAARK